MNSTLTRRYYRRTAPSRSDGSFFKKESQHEQSFFGETSHDAFFQPAVAPTNSIQRKCEECDKEDKVQRVEDKKEEEKKVMRAEDKKEEEKIQRAEDKKEEEKIMKMEDKKEEEKIQKKETGTSISSGKAVNNYVSSLTGKGNPLPDTAHHFFSSRMRYDFTNVKIHNDKAAAESAKNINAKAYTVGNNIVFNEGQYNTESGEGKKLMAHELAHVIQNENSRVEKVNRRTPTGFDVRGVYPDAASFPHTIFYDMDRVSIPPSEWYKVKNIATDFGGKPVTLTGTSSEEGDPATNLSLINNRIGGVDTVLKHAGHKLSHTRNPQPTATTGNIDYRKARNVEVVEKVGAPSTVDPCDKAVDPNADVEPCDLSVLTAYPLGLLWIATVLDKLRTPDATTTSQVGIFFPGVPVTEVTTNVMNLLIQFSQLLYHHVCHNTCDPLCARPANMDSSTGTMTLCPDFINEPSFSERAETLIHESLHATPGVMSADTAYSNTRLISGLTGAQALHNTDSYVLLIFSLIGLTPSSVPPNDTLDPLMISAEQDQAKNALAFLEQWLLWSQYDSSVLYDAINRNIGRAGGWDPADNGIAEVMHNLATLFSLTDPGSASPFTTTPVNGDKTKMAGMHDHYNRMMYAVYHRTLDIHKARRSRWQPGLGTGVDLDSSFFSLVLEDAVKALFALLVKSEGTVPSGLVNSYVEGGNQFRRHWSAGP